MTHTYFPQGKDFLSDGEGIRRGGLDPDYSKRDLWLAIDRGEYPSWTMCIQVTPAPLPSMQSLPSAVR